MITLEELNILIERLPQQDSQNLYSEIIYELIKPSIVLDLQKWDIDYYLYWFEQYSENNDLYKFCNKTVLDLSDILAERENTQLDYILGRSRSQIDFKQVQHIMYKLTHLANFLFTITQDIRNGVMLENVSRALGYTNDSDLIPILLPKVKALYQLNNIGWDQPE